MKINALLISFAMLIIPFYAHSQKKQMKFGKVSLQEFEYKPLGADSAAHAVKLFDVGDCYFQVSAQNGFQYVFERHIRYKIIDKSGYDFANFQIQLFAPSNGTKEDLYGMDAATYNIVNGQIVASKIGKDAKFTEKADRYHIIKRFALPNVKENSIVEYKYKIVSDFIFNIRSWQFQSTIPTVYSEYNVRIPEYLKYKNNRSGALQVNHPVSTFENATYIPGITSSAKYDKYIAENVPAIREEPYITTLDDFIPKIDFELTATNFPGSFTSDFNSTWPKIINSLIKDENFGGFVNKTGYTKNILPSIIKDEKDSLVIAKRIFEYVKNNIKWNKYFDKYSSEINPKTLFEKKAGSSADINLTIFNLLKAAKFNVLPVLISTRENGLHPGYPLISGFNSIVGIMEIGNNVYFIDGTDINLPFGLLNFQELSHQGFMVNLQDGNGSWISTEAISNYEKTNIYTLNLTKDNVLQGSINRYFKGYAGIDARSKYRNAANESEYVKDLIRDKNGLTINSYKMTNLDSLDQIFSESINATIIDNVEEAGNMVYLTPLLYERNKENIFKQQERSLPIDFAHSFKETFRVTIKFPEEYEVDKLPQNTVYKTSDNSGTFSISYLSEGKSILVKSVIDISKSFYLPDQYAELRELFKAIVERQSEQIVFKKKS